MDCIVHGVAKSCAQLSDFHSLIHSQLFLVPYSFSISCCLGDICPGANTAAKAPRSQPVLAGLPSTWPALLQPFDPGYRISRSMRWMSFWGPGSELAFLTSTTFISKARCNMYPDSKGKMETHLGESCYRVSLQGVWTSPTFILFFFIHPIILLMVPQPILRSCSILY